MIHIETTLPYEGVMDSCIGGRHENQDSCGFCETPNGLLLVVCDGMGGGPSGKLASSIAINEIFQFVKNNITKEAYSNSAHLLSEAVRHANMAIFSYANQNLETQGMGTTAVVVLLNENCATIAHVGDSRCYLMRKGCIVFKTADHSVVAELVRKGTLTEEQARISPNSNIITRVLGLKEHVDVDIDVWPYEKNDRFYLCSDGVWGAMPENQLVKQFYRYPHMANIIESTTMLLDEIGRATGGYHDNHTLIITETLISSKLEQTMSTKHKRLMQGMIILLVISLLINMITIFKREYNVSKMATLATKDSIIGSMSIDRKLLEAQIEKLKSDSVFMVMQVDQVKTQYMDSLKKLFQELESYKVKLQKLKTPHNVDASHNSRNKVSLSLPENLRTYLTEETKRENLLKAVRWLGNKNNKNKDKSKKDILERLERLKPDFESIGELENYDRLVELVKKYNATKEKKVSEIVDNILMKYK